MKCIKTKSGKIMRLPDFQALALVERGLAVYVPKSEWKRERERKTK
jgi:hypothetical protein